MFRLAFLSKSALASLLVTTYVAVLGVMGLAGGFIADRVSSHVGKSATKLVSTPRPVSRVEKWLKSQTVSYAVADVRSLDVVTPNGVGSSREILPVAVLAAAMDRSEQSVVVEAEVAAPVVARITAPVHQRRNTGEACLAGSCEGSAKKTRVTKTRLAIKVPGTGKSHQVAALKIKVKRNTDPTVALAELAPADGKMGLGLKPSFGTLKAPANVATKSPYKVWRDLHLADTPAEIIHRSLRGTS